MIQKIKDRCNRFSLLTKVWVIFCALTIALSIMITGISYYYYQYISSRSQLEHARSATNNAINTINVNYKDILDRMIEICGTVEFLKDVQLLSNPEATYINQEQAFQNELSDLASSNYLIHSALILSSDGSKAYTLYKTPLRAEVHEIATAEELSQLTEITFLSERKSPFRSNIPVVPVVIPFSQGDSGFGEINLVDKSAMAYIVIFLDSQKLNYSLEGSQGDNDRTSYYLMTSDYTVISGDWESRGGEVLNTNQTKVLLGGLSEHNSYDEYTQGTGYSLLVGLLEYSNIYLINYVEEISLLENLGTTGLLIVFLLIVVVILLLFTSFIMTRYVTKPVGRLVEIVKQIEHSTYDKKVVFHSEDEMGELCNAINGMYDTIQEQMIKIKEEEANKYMMEIRLLTEQVNPHFLYNTLECIQSEVFRGERDTASSMIQYLGEYLRIGLSYGADLIPISSELRHVNAYIKLMNQRFRKSITFMHRVSPGIGEVPILKTILQPLVENSIKHGFGIDASGNPTLIPTIEINFEKNDNILTIQVIDNGSGFDVKQARNIMMFKEAQQDRGHVGLHNVYSRLISYYGEKSVQIYLESIPYYRNEIRFDICNVIVQNCNGH